MTRFDLYESEIELYKAACDLLLTSHHEDNHRVAAAMRGTSGRIYFGIHLGSKRVNICAESSAVANARMAQEDAITCAVAVCMNESGNPQVTNPCGVCRELMRTYGPAASVLVDDGGVVGRVSIADLLPFPWNRAAENTWNVSQPEAAGRKIPE